MHGRIKVSRASLSPIWFAWPPRARLSQNNCPPTIWQVHDNVKLTQNAHCAHTSVQHALRGRRKSATVAVWPSRVAWNSAFNYCGSASALADWVSTDVPARNPPSAQVEVLAYFPRIALPVRACVSIERIRTPGRGGRPRLNADKVLAQDWPSKGNAFYWWAWKSVACHSDRRQSKKEFALTSKQTLDGSPGGAELQEFAFRSCPKSNHAYHEQLVWADDFQAGVHRGRRLAVK